MSKYPENKLFEMWTPEQQRNFKIDTRVDNKSYQTRGNKPGSSWGAVIGGYIFAAFPNAFYRLAPEPEIDDSIDWSHVHPDWIKLVRHIGMEDARLVNKENGFGTVSAKTFASYRPGNKPSCIVYRPGFEPQD